VQWGDFTFPQIDKTWVFDAGLWRQARVHLRAALASIGLFPAGGVFGDATLLKDARLPCIVKRLGGYRRLIVTVVGACAGITTRLAGHDLKTV